MATTLPAKWGAWTLTTVNASAIANGGTGTTEAISLDGVNAARFSVTAVYASGTVTAGLLVYILTDVDGTNYEAVADAPDGFEMPKSSGGTFRRAFTVSGEDINSVKIHAVNSSGVQVTVTIRYRNQTITVVTV
jgi:hypothetical protein